MHIVLRLGVTLGVIGLLIMESRVVHTRRIEQERLIREYRQITGELDYPDLLPVLDGSLSSWIRVILMKRHTLRKVVAEAAEMSRFVIERQYQEVVALRAKDPSAEDYNRLQALKKAHLSDEDRAWVEDQLEQLADARVTALLEESRHGNSRAFSKLEAFVSIDSHGECEYLSDAGKRYVYPLDWDVLVARLIPYPLPSNFRHQRTEFSDGEFGQLVAQALNTGSPVQLKWAYARCSRGNHYRKQIGDVLLAELTKQVHALNVSLGLTTANSATTTS